MESLEQSSGHEAQRAGRPFWRRYRWIVWLAAAVAAVLLSLSIFLAIVAHEFEPFLRAEVVGGLQDRFHTRVELDSFHVSVHHGIEAQWGIWATGRGLRIWPPQRAAGNNSPDTAAPPNPLIQLDEFSFHVPLRYKTAQPLHIPEVRLTGLQIRIQPRSEKKPQAVLQSALKPPATVSAQPQSSRPPNAKVLSSVVVDRILCQDAMLEIETDKPDKLPLTFDIQRLVLTRLTRGQPMSFDARLINARPRGSVDTSGTFGPWDSDDPGSSPVSGKYFFDHADLSGFKGIAGFLSSTGTYAGTLRDIVVDGQTHTPDFQLTHFGATLPLRTQFHARVDGTDGDTWIDQLEATLGTSQFITTGQIVRIKVPAEPATGDSAHPAVTEGHVVDLKVDIPHGQIADFLHLVSKSAKPLLEGVVESKATLHIPTGKEPVHQRLKLDGYFKLDDARFASEKVQARIQDLSLRGQGRPGALKTADASTITSRMQGTFHLANGVIALPALEYQVPGADIQMNGTYALDGQLDFAGVARMDATLSQMVGGWKGFLLKPADRYFKRDGAGTMVPIKVQGSRESPEFSLDLGQMKHTSPQRPGQQ